MTGWDSKLVDACGRPRLAYSALRDWRARGERAGRNGGRRALCRGVS